jgi:hypothetical protein
VYGVLGTRAPVHDDAPRKKLVLVPAAHGAHASISPGVNVFMGHATSPYNTEPSKQINTHTQTGIHPHTHIRVSAHGQGMAARCGEQVHGPVLQAVLPVSLAVLAVSYPALHGMQLSLPPNCPLAAYVLTGHTVQLPPAAL